MGDKFTGVVRPIHARPGFFKDVITGSPTIHANYIRSHHTLFPDFLYNLCPVEVGKHLRDNVDRFLLFPLFSWRACSRRTAAGL